MSMYGAPASQPEPVPEPTDATSPLPAGGTPPPAGGSAAVARPAASFDPAVLGSTVRGVLGAARPPAASMAGPPGTAPSGGVAAPSGGVAPPAAYGAVAAPAAGVPAAGVPGIAVPAQQVAPGQTVAGPQTAVAPGQVSGATGLVGSTATAARAAAAAVATPTAAPARAAAAQAAAAAAGTVYGGGNTPGTGTDRRRNGHVRSLHRLRIGAHVASDTALGMMKMSGPTMGLLLGQDSDKQPVSVRLFRPEPTRATLVGGQWAAQLVLFRALALGARAVVFTSAPDQWERFGHWATGRNDRVAVLPAERAVTVAASAQIPALLVYDVGNLGPSTPQTLGPWQSQLTVLRQLTAYGFPAVQESNLVMMQRLTGAEAYAMSSVLRLDPQTGQLLQMLGDDMLALLGSGADRYLWLTPTRVERHSLGPPQR